ncbi:hypothetical protein LIER_19961 [Lithospermum erythrorhizon]|uniref:Pentatricopeptide repeat-containing protein n=1 Tax=Lithospermum erythrorhizon TaxID=34254 RepID=A0AAV3QMQ6_LITER
MRMSARKLFSVPQHYQIPQTIRKYLHMIQSHNTHLSSPFLPKSPLVLSTNLIKSYFKNGQIFDACLLFDEMPSRDVVVWTTMITEFASRNLYSRALGVFRHMINDDQCVKPNEFTFSSVLKACKGMDSLSCGAMVHGLLMKYGIRGSLYVENALLDMYASCSGSMEDACSIFKDICVKNAVSWTTLITGYTHRGDELSGLLVFKQMLLEDAEINTFSFSIAVRACASIGLSAGGKQIHAAVIKHGLECNTPVMNSLVDMYCRCDSLIEANQCFDAMEERDLITWNTLIAGYEKCDPNEALNVYSRMESEGVIPNCFTFTTVIAAVSNLAVLSGGEQVHGGIIRRGLQRNLALANALLSMYAKCGEVAYSLKVFNDMTSKDLVSWTSMMIAYGSHGYGEAAALLFDQMISSGIWPDRVVFMAVISACSHAGLLDKGLRYFKSMFDDYHIIPDQEAYGCLIDLLGRAGRLEEAYQLIQSMPFLPDESVWGAFLGACKAHKNADMAKLVSREVLGLRPNTAGTYHLMFSNIYAADGEWGEYAKMRKLMKSTGNRKEAGRSWVEVRNQIHSFVAGDKVGSHVESVYDVLEVLIQHAKDAGHALDIGCLTDDMEEGTRNYS